MKKSAQTGIPFDIYVSLVDALYEVQSSLFIGSTAASIAAVITGARAQSLTLLAFGGVIAAVAYLRALDMRAYRRARASFKTRDEFRRWEGRYIVGATVYVGLLGTWCLASFIVSADPLIELFCFSVLLAYMIGTCGRNFSSNLLVVSQIAGGGIPLAASLAWRGGAYFFILFLVIIPFLAAIKLISDRLRRQLLSVVIAEREVRALAGRFDTALTNMPVGLCMFDEEGRILVDNERLMSLLHLSSDERISGRTFGEVLRASPIILSPEVSATDFIDEFERLISDATGRVHMETNGQRALAFTAQPMAEGGSVVVLEDVTDRRNAERRIRHLARYDALTDLPNRAVFHDELADQLSRPRNAGSIAILFIDLDQFKQVNDSLGHPVGDLLLCAVAERLRHATGETDLVARFGGDEFAVLRVDASTRADLAALSHDIIKTVARPYQISGHTVVISTSIGISLAPEHGNDADILLKNADLALYHSKSGGSGRWCFFEPDMDVAMRARRDMELDLRDALQNERFELHFQPLLDLREMRIVACEALLRWHHPVRGTVLPGEFIPVAEEMGIIVEIGDWVLRKAALECARWKGDVRVAVNLSSVQFRRGDIVASVVNALEESGLDPKRLEIEITETVVLQDIEEGRNTLESMRRIGIRVALDDFGTGYSGLSYLQNLPLNKVKIDRSFVQQITASERARILLRGMAELSAALGMTVAVEGIETIEQLDVVMKEPAINEAQGFLFSRPISAAAIRELIETSAPLKLALKWGRTA